MRRTRFATAVLTAALVAWAAELPAIEMFTYFGDGSRIGLPSLEVPIEAYPGIPLRSDRIRARRKATRPRPGPSVGVEPGTPVGGVTIRSMPTPTMPPPVAIETVPTPRPATGQPAAN
jgi:hypothetical protein